MGDENRIAEIESELQGLSEKRKSLLAELKTLNKPEKIPKYGSKIDFPYSSGKDRIILFLSLFRCREGVYPRYWENKKTGKKGYSPVCTNEWANGMQNFTSLTTSFSPKFDQQFGHGPKGRFLISQVVKLCQLELASFA